MFGIKNKSAISRSSKNGCVVRTGSNQSSLRRFIPYQSIEELFVNALNYRRTTNEEIVSETIEMDILVNGKKVVSAPPDSAYHM
ncbi:hypothetical protein GWI33_021951 [Rhynchophorus ferrugineus]|uniref:Uncharacterized protein n=1 Tax=Rhynchophorus ferrugineus TaxID=354439 RepID=A0A834IQL0_RHYFE|nr:hypothetical protein GWI33_021951 [Rhynchophorus ferrugineus]